MKYKILFTSSEAVPFAKVGGLADMISALSKALIKEKQDVRIILPKHRSVNEFMKLNHIHPLSQKYGFIMIEDREYPFTIEEVSYGENNFIFIDMPELFDRENPYTNPGTGKDYLDNLIRYSFFDKAVLETCKILSWIPNIIHCHDWHMGLIPLLRNAIPEYKALFLESKTVFTIHNLAYQGIFSVDQYPLLGLDWKYFHVNGLEYYRHINFMKGGIVFSDAVNTVSPTYAKEITSENLGAGLEGVIHEKTLNGIFCGIMNGVDYSEWDPEHDEYIAKNYQLNYNHESLENKQKIKERFAQENNLQLNNNTPLIGIITRLYDQKGLDIFLETAEDLVRQNIAFTILGTGKTEYENRLLDLEGQYPDLFNVHIGFNIERSHLIEAASDMLLMPSQFEPCGLNQLYSLKYGTVPIVRKTGGLADSVEHKKTGFTFEKYHPQALYDVVMEAVTIWRDHPEKWTKIVQKGMKQDWSWKKSAKGYINLYRQISNKKPLK